MRNKHFSLEQLSAMLLHTEVALTGLVDLIEQSGKQEINIEVIAALLSPHVSAVRKVSNELNNLLDHYYLVPKEE